MKKPGNKIDDLIASLHNSYSGEKNPPEMQKLKEMNVEEFLEEARELEKSMEGHGI